MNDLIPSLQDFLNKQLTQSNYEVVGVIPLPMHRDRLVRLRTLEETLEEFDSTFEEGTIQYLLQVKTRKATPNKPIPTKVSAPEEAVYLPNGKLNTSYLMKNADLLFDANDYTLAKNLYKTILQTGEATGVALYKAGRCLEAESQYDDACRYYEESIAYQPSLESYQRLATLYIRQSKDLKASEVIERALNLKDLTPSVKFELFKAAGNCWTRGKNLEKAEMNFNKALEIDPSADEIRSNLGTVYLQNNKISEAKRNFQDSIASNPKNFRALAGLGNCFLAEGDKKSAHDHFVQSLKIEINNPTAIFYLVKCAYELKSYATAEKILREYIHIAPINANLLYSLAGLQFHLGKMGEAKKTVDRILQIQPNHAGAQELAKRILQFIGPSV